MDKEQIKAIAEKADDYADNYLKSKGEYHPNWHDVRDEHFYHSAIESYEAELLADFGEPVAEFKRHPFGDYTELSFSAGYSARRGDKLYTSDQVAAAIAKATKPLEEEMSELKIYKAAYRMAAREMTEQLAASQAYAEQLLEALTACVCAMQDYQAGIGITEMFDKGERLGRKALATHSDISALGVNTEQK